MSFTATTANKVLSERIPSKPLNELSYDYLLYFLSPTYLPFECSYYACEYVRHERYLDIYNKYRKSHKEILNKIDEEIEEIRKVLYKLICKEVGEKQNSRYSYDLLFDRVWKEEPEKHERNIMYDLKRYVTGNAKEIIEKLEKERIKSRNEFERREEELERIYAEQELEYLKRLDEEKERKKREKEEQEEKRIKQIEEYNKAWKRLKDLSWSAEAKYIWQHSNLDGISQEWLNEVKRLFEIVGKNTSDENIIYEISYLAEQTD